MSDEEKQAIEFLKEYQDKPPFIIWKDNMPYNKKIQSQIILNLIEKQSKEIEELKASHIMTHNKSTNTEKAKIFDVIENSIDTYIEKSKPYWEQTMTKDEMTIDEALTIIDDMYQDRYKIMSQKTEKETIVDLSKMYYINFTNLEWASVRALREVQSLLKEIEELKETLKCTQNSWYEDTQKLEELKEKNKSIIYNYEMVVDKLENSTSNDKIKAKIEVLEKLQKEFPNNDEIRIKIIAYKELLEKE